MKSLHNVNISDALANTSDLKVIGNGDLWQLLCKTSSEAEGWMKSTKVMEVEDMFCPIEGTRSVAGCFVQVTTQQWDQVAEAIVYVPNVRIADCGTKLVRI